MRRLEEWGARFRKEADGRYTQTIRPGVTVARNCFVVEGGHGMLRAYGRTAGRSPRISLLEDRQVIRLVTAEGRAVGRLSGNAFPECLVFAARAGAEAARTAREEPRSHADWRGAVNDVVVRQAAWYDMNGGNGKAVRPIHLKARLQEVMGRDAGVVRDEAGLRHTLDRLAELRAEALPALQADAASRFCRELGEAHEVTAMVDLAERVVRSALFRCESRGHHLRTDCPGREDAVWRVHTVVRPWRGQGSASAAATAPVLEAVPVTDDRGTP